MVRGGRRRFITLAGVLALTAAAAACGGSGGGKPAEGTTAPASNTPQTAVQTTDLGPGVTKDSVRIGVALIDYSAIAQFVDFKRGDQQKIFQAFVDDINAKGGVAGGKKLVPVYETYKPFGATPALAVCTSLTEDKNVFAVVGLLLYDPSGAAQTCVTKQHQRVLITSELSEDIMKKAPPGLLLSPFALAERVTRSELEVADKQGLLKGKKVGILAEKGTKSRISSTIEPELKKLGIPVGTAGVLQINDSSGSSVDTTAAQAQLDSLIERWKGEGTNAVFVSGLAAVSRDYVKKIKDAMPDALLLTDSDSSAKAAGGDAKDSGLNPNPYDGMLALVGRTDQQQFDSAKLQQCIKLWEDKSHTSVVAPNALKAGPDGKREEIWISVVNSCEFLDLFKQVADRVGPNLNVHNWSDAVDHFGSTTALAGSDAASLGPGKYDADNNFALVAFDSSIGASGDWK
jgi:hypothetical protein